jgi:catechol 2,3-dioxygenase-like lactoylglutathione lyase family enzyme
MLSDSEIYAVLPASDLGRARTFYQEKLGLEPVEERSDGLIYQAKGGPKFLLYETQFAGTAQNTAMNFVTGDLDAEMSDLRSRGVTFEDYDFPGLKTENGVAEYDGGRGGWFKDSEGNILALGEMS